MVIHSSSGPAGRLTGFDPYDTNMNPTDQTYKSLTEAYEFFNKELFEGKLTPCLITMQRKGKSRGYFCPDRFETRGETTAQIHEIALNPSLFKDRTDEEILSTLLHEMIHLWQEENGTAPRRNYHNKEWGSRMEEMGLMPSNTGEEGGRRTGQSMSHYIIEGGKFKGLMFNYLLGKKSIFYQDNPMSNVKRQAKKNKVKYTCNVCGLNAWGKPNANLMCGDHKTIMMEDSA